MISTTPSIEDLVFNLSQEIQVNAPPEIVFEALLEEIGPENQSPDGKRFPMTIERWVGGRWYRDLGDGNGHLWGLVQAIKPPSLLEITGPLFMSYPVISNVQYRLSEEGGGTLITFQHKALGVIQEEHRRGMTSGWSHILERIRVRVNALSSLR